MKDQHEFGQSLAASRKPILRMCVDDLIHAATFVVILVIVTALGYYGLEQSLNRSGTTGLILAGMITWECIKLDRRD